MAGGVPRFPVAVAGPGQSAVAGAALGDGSTMGGVAVGRGEERSIVVQAQSSPAIKTSRTR